MHEGERNERPFRSLPRNEKVGRWFKSLVGAGEVIYRVTPVPT